MPKLGAAAEPIGDIFSGVDPLQRATLIKGIKGEATMSQLNPA